MRRRLAGGAAVIAAVLCAAAEPGLVAPTPAAGPSSTAEPTLPRSAAVSWNRAVRAYPGLRIPRVWLQLRDPGTAPGYMFLTPRARPGQRTGPTILDNEGRVVWFRRLPRTRTAIGLQPQVYRGRPVLTWGQRAPLRKEGDLYSGNPRSVYHVIVDERYRVIARVRARGVTTDLHEFAITPRNTALLLGFRYVARNLTRYGGQRHGSFLDNVVQEVDIATGRVLFQWSAVRRLNPRDSLVRPPATGPWDAYHVNSVTEDSDGDLLLTARHTSAVYKVSRRTGRVLWKLGGKDSSFKVARSARFWYPHDVQRRPDGTLTIFDNRSSGFDRSRGRRSQALRLQVDGRRRTVRALASFRHPAGNVLATSQGNARELEGGNMFVGWGSSPWFSEHAPDGRVLFAARFASAWNQSYRAFKGPWQAAPQRPPAIAASVARRRLTVFAAWNGATAVANWRVRGGPTRESLADIGGSRWMDFETRIDIAAAPAFVQVQALDAAGNVLGASRIVKPKTPRPRRR